jgi:malate dehydrogenase
VRLTAEQEQEAESAIRKWFSTYQALQSGRTSGWTSAVGIGLVVEAIVTGTGPVLPCSAHLHGQYGLSGISLGMPVKLGFEGIEEVLEMPLTPAQRERFEAAARKVRGLAEDVLARV